MKRVDKRARDLVRGDVIATGRVREVIAWHTEDGVVLVDVYVYESRHATTWTAASEVATWERET